jgi:hypothetical protein
VSWWSERAAQLQSGVRSDEAGHVHDYPLEEVRRSVVHSREDIVLLIGHVDAVNMQLRTIKWLLAVIAVSLIYFALR